MKTRATLESALWRATLLGGLWWVLAEGDLGGWLYALILVGVAVATSLALVPPSTWRWRLRELPRFLVYFLHQSLLGGIDVARRAFDPRLPVDPGFVVLPLRLHGEPARVFLSNTMSLLPGTLSVELRGDSLVLHVLDRSTPAKSFSELEKRVARLFVSPGAAAEPR